MPRKEHHVVHNKVEGGWDVKRNGAKRVSTSHSNTKAEAERKARVISTNQGTELVIHRVNGKIQRSDSHGNDPCPPKDH